MDDLLKAFLEAAPIGGEGGDSGGGGDSGSGEGDSGQGYGGSTGGGGGGDGPDGPNYGGTGSSYDPAEDNPTSVSIGPDGKATSNPGFDPGGGDSGYDEDNINAAAKVGATTRSLYDRTRTELAARLDKNPFALGPAPLSWLGYIDFRAMAKRNGWTIDETYPGDEGYGTGDDSGGTNRDDSKQIKVTDSSGRVIYQGAPPGKATGTQAGDYDMGDLDDAWQGGTGTGGDLMQSFSPSSGGGALMEAFQGPDSTEARNAFRGLADIDDSDARNAFAQLMAIDDSKARGLYDESASISRQMWQDWDAHGRTTLATLGDELKERSTEAHAARAAGLAASDVNQAFDTETANLRRDMQRYGIDPTSGRAMAGMRGLSLGRAGAVAGAQTRTRMAEEDRLFNDRLNFVNTLDNSGKLASSAAAGLATAAAGHGSLDQAKASRFEAAGSGFARLTEGQAQRQAQMASGLAGIDASERQAMLGDLNARRNLLSAREGRELADLNARRGLLSEREARSLQDLNARRTMKIGLEELAFRERDSLRRDATSRYAADKGAQNSRDSALYGAGGNIIGGVVGGWLGGLLKGI